GNLLREGHSEDTIHVTGNTVVDALLEARASIEASSELLNQMVARFPQLDAEKRLVVVTGDRRESFDGGLAQVCHALVKLAERGDVQIIYPVHPNPQVVRTVAAALSGHPDIV